MDSSEQWLVRRPRAVQRVLAGPGGRIAARVAELASHLHELGLEVSGGASPGRLDIHTALALIRGRGMDVLHDQVVG